MSAKTKVLVVDDHEIVAKGVTELLNAQADFEVVGWVSRASDVFGMVHSLKADIIVMDLLMPGNGMETTHRLLDGYPDVSVVVYTMFSDKEHIIPLFKAGVSGYVLKDDSFDDLVMALRTAKRGGVYYSARVQAVVQDQMLELELGDAKKVMEMKDGIAVLTPREKEVFPLLADGVSIQEISRRLAISSKTVETHKYNIMEKLNAKSMATLTKIAYKKGLLKL
jgi:DNA-binding NarL/FixJ family response regulator